MKIIKFFSLAMLLSLAWVSCKNAATTDSANTEAVADSVFVATQSQAAYNMSALGTAVSNKITELEASLATASDDAKAGITAEIETYKKFQADLTSAASKVANATAENWAEVNTEVEAVHFAVKTAITGNQPTAEKAAQIAN